MEQTVIMKGVALFATLIGVYQWLGQGTQGTSLFDIMILLFATALIISIDADRHAKPEIPEVAGDYSQPNESLKKFFSRSFAIVKH